MNFLYEVLIEDLVVSIEVEDVGEVIELIGSAHVLQQDLQLTL